MDYINDTYKVYVKTNADGIITAVNSSAFLSDTTGWTEVDEGSGDKYHHAQSNYLDKPIIDDKWLYNYKLVDGVVTERTQEEKDLELFPSVITTKIAELSKVCTESIYKGIDVTLTDGTTEHFTLDQQDQLNLSGLALKLLMGATEIAWHEDDTTVQCRFYSAEDANKIINSLIAFKEYHITYFRDLRIYVNTLSTKADVESITYGFALPDDAKSDVLKKYEAQIGA